MTPPVRFYPRARHDLLELTTYLTEQAGVDVADRLLQAVHFATAALARQPRMGKLFETTRRIWRACAGFRHPLRSSIT
jgi:plasmid stabilization system protein ParE